MHRDNNHPTGITTDGTYIWVVNEGNRRGGVGDKVYVYTVGGSYLGRWQLDNANRRPTGITIDPTGGDSIWIVDNGKNQVFEYSMATGVRSGGLSASKVFDLADGNHCPQGIADPPAAPSTATPLTDATTSHRLSSRDLPGDAPVALSDEAGAALQLLSNTTSHESSATHHAQDIDRIFDEMGSEEEMPLTVDAEIASLLEHRS